MIFFCIFCHFLSSFGRFYENVIDLHDMCDSRNLIFIIVITIANLRPILLNQLNSIPQIENDLENGLDGWTEKILIRDLFENYDKRSRPVVDGISKLAHISINYTVQQITIEFGLNLIQILDLNEMDQVLTSSTRSLFRWNDPNLMWNPELYGNISVVNVPADMLWIPDISLYNYADERLEERRSCDAKIYPDGTVDWQPMAIYKSTCSVNIRYFPFDEQRCWLKFGPWTYDGYRVNITFYGNNTNMDLTNFIPSPEWEVLATRAKHTEIKYPCCPEIYPDIKFYIWIRREPAFYTYILILPCFLLSSLTLVLFWLPPESPAKMVLGMNIFVAFFLLLLLLEDTTPSASSNFPLIGTYYCLNMGLITFSSFVSCLIVNFHFRGDNKRQVPHFIKKVLFIYVAKFLYVKLNPKVIKSCQEDMNRSFKKRSSQFTVKFNLLADLSEKSPDENYSEDDHKIKSQESSKDEVHSSSNFAQGISGDNKRTSFQFNSHDNDWEFSIGHFKLPQSELDVEIIRDQNGHDVAKTFQKFQRKISNHIKDIVKNLRFLQNLHHVREISQTIEMEWRAVGLVVDRVYFFCYIFIIVLSMASYFPRDGESKFDVENST